MSSQGKLGYIGLSALVFGLVVGTGIYNLPQNLSAVASPTGIALAWLITGAGIFPLVLAFKYLSERFPQYNAGLYQYAEAGFGRYAGFNIAWGYWLCSAFSNLTFGIMLCDACGAFFPPLLDHGWEMILFCSVMIWVMYAIVVVGVQTANFINKLLAALKIVMILFIIVVFIIFFDSGLFHWDGIAQNVVRIGSQTQDAASGLPAIGNLGEQIRGSMLITLFCFFGVEGAVTMAARARKPSDVGRAGLTGFLIALTLYMAVSLLCFGLLNQTELANLPDPSIAYILLARCGPWAYWFVIAAVIVSLLGGWVSWTLVVSQVPYEASLVGVMPKIFSRVNRRGMPALGLFASSLAMEAFLLLVVMADNVYMTALEITSLMIIPCYFFTALFMLKRAKETGPKIIAAIAALFCVWMAYAGGPVQMIMTSGFYLIGLPFYIKTRREQLAEVGNPTFIPSAGSSSLTQIFTRGEKLWILLFSLGTLFSLYELL